jgi:peptidoglycan/LPS O-acetylase OafA/YrhL
MRRVPEFDALRAVAAMAVLLFHLYPVSFSPGWTGVDLFFVLSGFLITTIILDHLDSPRSLGTFYARRGLRIWPIYYLTVAALVAVTPLIPAARRPTLAGLWHYLTFTQNAEYYWLKTPPVCHQALNHTWTLALEEQFYLIWPALIGLASWSAWDRVGAAAGRLWRPAARLGFRLGWGRRMVAWRRDVRWLTAPGGRRFRLMALCLGAIVLSRMAREGGWLRPGPYSSFILIARCGGFGLGALVAVILGDRDRVARHLVRYRVVALAVLAYASVVIARGCYPGGAIGYFGIAAPADPVGTIFMANLFYAGIIATVATFAGHPLLAPLRWRPLCYLGLISYGVYLYHVPVYWFFDSYRFADQNTAWDGAEKIALTVALAVASWHLVERPILSLKHRFRYDRGDLAASEFAATSEPAAAH